MQMVIYCLYICNHFNNVCNYIGGGVDYNSGVFNVTFPAGSTNASFDIIIIDDGVLENNEMFFFTIHSITNGLLMHIPPLSVINIIDTTGMTIFCIV